MITAIKSTNHLNESITIDLFNPAESGLAVLSIDGLGSPKAEISLTERAAVDGAIYNSGRATPRDIIIRFRFIGDDIAAIRQKTYKYFPLNRPIDFEVQSTNRNAHTTAYVEANEPDIFTNEAGCVITMRCPDAYLYDVVAAQTDFSSITANFEFPWSNPTTGPELEMSLLDTGTTKNVLYEGDASVGMLLHIHATGSASGFTLTEVFTLNALAIDSTKLIATVGADITTGDDIWISTVVGNKYAILIRSGTTYNILNCLGANPTWFQLEKGDNIFAYTATSGLVNLQFVIHNQIAYEGV